MKIPLVPYYITWYGTQDFWIGADPERYSLTLFRPGSPLRIESDFTPIAATARERQSILDSNMYRMKAQGSQMTTPLSIVPSSKPAFKAVVTDIDGRIWVELHRPGKPEPIDTIKWREALLRNQFTIVDGKEVARQGAPVSPSRPSMPTEHWVEPIVYDVFATTGQFIGRVSLPAGAEFGNAKGDKIWLIEHDSDDVPTVVRYRVEGALSWSSQYSRDPFRY